MNDYIHILLISNQKRNVSFDERINGSGNNCREVMRDNRDENEWISAMEMQLTAGERDKIISIYFRLSTFAMIYRHIKILSAVTPIYGETIARLVS